MQGDGDRSIRLTGPFENEPTNSVLYAEYSFEQDDIDILCVCTLSKVKGNHVEVYIVCVIHNVEVTDPGKHN